MTFLRTLYASPWRAAPDSSQDTCLQLWEWHRLLWSAFLHADETHLYYNMSSFLWKVRGLALAACEQPTSRA